MSRRGRLIGGALGFAGLALAAAFLLADRLGFGDAPGIGWQQGVGVASGVLIALAGTAVARRPPRLALPSGLSSRLALAAGSLLVSLLLAEAGFRLIKPPSVEANHLPLIYQPDPLIGYRFVPNSRGYIERLEYRVPIRINSAGFFDDEYSLDPPPGVTRIVAIGDSFTAGFQVGRGHNFPDVLERQLNQSGAGACPCQVLNFGLDGTGTVQQARLFEQAALTYQPDIVLIAFYSNDVVNAQAGTVHRDVYRGFVLLYRNEAQREALTHEVDDVLRGGGGALRFGIWHSYLVRALYNWYQGEGKLPEPNLRDNRVRANLGLQLTDDEARAQIVKSVERMQSACRAAGCEIVFVALPDKPEVVYGDASLDTPIITEALAERGVRTLSLLEAFRQHADRGETLFWEHDGHCNEAGYHLIGVEIAAYLQREGLVSGD